MLMRKAATWALVKASKPRFMRMKELPHTIARAKRMIHFKEVFFM